MPARSASLWRSQPYRIFFPLGAALAWAGVLPWLISALDLGPGKGPIVHSIAQIQGFLACFAVGFLMTMIPRRTGTAPPTSLELALCALALAGTVAGAWFGALMISQLGWILLVAVLIRFVVARFRAKDAARRPPASFVWIPVALATSLAGTALLAAYGIAGLAFEWHRLGQALLLQGTFLGLIAGVGALALPLMTRGEAPPDEPPGLTRGRLLHLLAAAVLLASFFVEAFLSPRLGYGLRAVVMALVLVLGAGIHRLPTRPGWNRRLIHASGFAIPLGYTLALLMPEIGEVQLGLHVVFIGGFGLMALAIGAHVSVAHGGHPELANGRPWQVPVFGGLLALAVVFRGLLALDPGHYRLWLGLAAAAFLAATLAWAALFGAGVRGPRRTAPEPRPEGVPLPMER